MTGLGRRFCSALYLNLEVTIVTTRDPRPALAAAEVGKLLLARNWDIFEYTTTTEYEPYDTVKESFDERMTATTQ